MTETIQDYRFDFETEAPALLRRMGKLGDHMMFLDINVTPPQPPETLATVNVPGALCGKGIEGGTANQILHEIIKYYEDYENRDTHGAAHFPMSIKENGKRIPLYAVALRNSAAEENFGKEYASLMRLWALVHETGHTLAHDLGHEEGSPRGEIAADAYAALYFLQRFGGSAVPFISQMSWMRALNSLHGDTLHLTSFALDKIIADYNAGKLSNLDHEQMVMQAKDYAINWTPDTAAFLEARESFMPHLQAAMNVRHDRLETLLDGTFLSSPNAVAEYPIARVAMPFLVQADARYRGKKLNLTDQQREKYTGLIRDWAKGGLGGIFSERTAREKPAAVLDMLQLRRFSGQAFNYRP